MSTRKRGFAALSLEARRAIASLGGLAAQKAGTGHRWTSAEARIAGRMGGSRSKSKRKVA